MLGKVISSSTEGIQFRIEEDEDFEEVKVGNLVVIESRYSYLGRIVKLEARNLGEHVLPDKMAGF
ncbi:MAG: hypothetical protein HXS47_09835, partial [Theionarchaea archaeon]|nr:hypothetical protein [Theionarchaea archaeon]MBU7043878.1 hypothetical protein [Theionarchaea archaeon]